MRVGYSRCNRYNRKLNEKIRDLINSYYGTFFAEQLKRAYLSNTSYEEICKMCNLNPEDYGIEV